MVTLSGLRDCEFSRCAGGSSGTRRGGGVTASERRLTAAEAAPAGPPARPLTMYYYLTKELKWIILVSGGAGGLLTGQFVSAGFGSLWARLF